VNRTKIAVKGAPGTYYRQDNRRIFVQVKVDGRLKSCVRDTLSLAKEWAIEETSRANKGEVVYDSKTTFAQLWERLEILRATPTTKYYVSASTRKKNASHWDNYLRDEFGGRAVVQFRSGDVDDWFATRPASAKSRRKPAGVPTLNECVILLQAILSYALDLELVPRNYLDGRDPIAHNPRPKRYVSVDELRRVIAEIREPYRTAVEVCCTSGLRWGELAGIRAEDVDLRNRQIRISTPWTRHEGPSGRPGHRDRPKGGEAGKRWIPLQDHLVPRVRDAVLRAGGNVAGLVFAGPRGGALNDITFNRRILKPACIRAGLEPMSVSYFRHAWTSHQVEDGTPILELTKLGGWGSSRMIEQHYAHLAPDAMDRARQATAARWTVEA
jgi:integrase